MIRNWSNQNQNKDKIQRDYMVNRVSISFPTAGHSEAYSHAEKALSIYLVFIFLCIQNCNNSFILIPKLRDSSESKMSR